MTYAPGPETLRHLAALVHEERPQWDELLVLAILQSHAHAVTGTDLAIAALRCAANPDMPGPKAIGWRGPHWRDLKTMPAEVQSPARCDTCGKPEPRCYSERIGIDDDHAFEPVRPVAR